MLINHFTTSDGALLDASCLTDPYNPYHPQTDGLVEQFNQTLKQILKKSIDEEGKVAKDWDTLLPYLLTPWQLSLL